MHYRAVIFDLDGTLLDTLADLTDAGNAALAQYGYPPHLPEDYKVFVGEGVDVLMWRMLPEERRDAEMVADLELRFAEEYAQRWNAKTRPYDGIESMLDSLTSQGIRMAILSNKPDDFTQTCVHGMLSRWKFDVIAGHHKGIPHKPDPTVALQMAKQWQLSPEEIVFVGDTSTDMKTAVAAKMFAVGVPWGFRDEAELRKTGANVVITHPEQLLDVMRDGQPHE